MSRPMSDKKEFDKLFEQEVYRLGKEIFSTRDLEVFRLGCEWAWNIRAESIKQVEEKYHEAMTIMSEWKNIDSADAVAQLQQAREQILGLQKQITRYEVEIEEDIKERCELCRLGFPVVRGQAEWPKGWWMHPESKLCNADLLRERRYQRDLDTVHR